MKNFSNTMIFTSNALSPSTTAYADGDAVGGELLTFTDVVPGTRGGGVVVDAELLDTSTVVTSYDLYLFDADPSGTNYDSDNSPFDLADTDSVKMLGKLAFSSGTVDQFADNQVYHSTGEVNFYLDGANDLYGVLVSAGTPTIATGNTLIVRLAIQRDSE